jgi:hypothetical protein
VKTLGKIKIYLLGIDNRLLIWTSILADIAIFFIADNAVNTPTICVNTIKKSGTFASYPIYRLPNKAKLY